MRHVSVEKEVYTQLWRHVNYYKQLHLESIHMISSLIIRIALQIPFIGTWKKNRISANNRNTNTYSTVKLTARLWLLVTTNQFPWDEALLEHRHLGQTDRVIFFCHLWKTTSSRLAHHWKTLYVTGFRSVVVITSALHAEGRRFEPGRKQMFFFSYDTISCYPSAASSLEN